MFLDVAGSLHDSKFFANNSINKKLQNNKPPAFQFWPQGVKRFQITSMAWLITYFYMFSTWRLLILQNYICKPAFFLHWAVLSALKVSDSYQTAHLYFQRLKFALKDCSIQQNLNYVVKLCFSYRENFSMCGVSYEEFWWWRIWMKQSFYIVSVNIFPKCKVWLKISVCWRNVWVLMSNIYYI